MDDAQSALRRLRVVARSGRRREEATLGVDNPGEVPVAVAVPYRQYLRGSGVHPADWVSDLRPLVVPLGVRWRHVGAAMGQVRLPELPIPVRVVKELPVVG